MSPLSNRIRPCIQRLKPYRPGKPVEEVKRELGLDDVIKMASNENPLGPSPKALEAMKSALYEVNLYPDAESYYLKEALSRKFGFPPEMFVLGCGSDELLHLVGLAFIEPNDEIIFADPSFVIYESTATLMDAKLCRIPLRDQTIDLPAMSAAVTEKTKVIFIPNPNNPTGTMVKASEVDVFLRKVPQSVIVVFDEAYVEYIEADDYPQTLDYIKTMPNVLVLHTFSKIYGLAGLRLGYGIGSAELIGYLNQVREPFNVNLIAQQAAIAALDDTEHVERAQKMNSEGKQYLYRVFDSLGLPYAPSQANFIWVDVKDNCVRVFEELLKQGVITRTGDVFGCPTHLRVTIGTQEQNERFVIALKKAKSNLH